MRLIDADALIEGMDNRYKEKQGIVPDNLAEGFMQMEKLIKEQPTAFNLDAVVEQLENGGQKMAEAKSMKPYGKSSPSCHRYYKAISVKKAVDIVRNGGKE